MSKANNTVANLKPNGSMSVGEIAELVGAEVVGDPNIEILRLQPLQTAGGGDLTFFAPTSPRVHGELLQLAKTTGAAAILLAKPIDDIKTTQIIFKHPLAAASQVALRLHPKPLPELGIDSTARIHESVAVGTNVRIAPYVVIGADAVIGNNVVIHPHVVIYPRALIGNDCVIHSGAVIREDVRLGADCQIQNGAIIGGDGFGYFPDPVIGHRRIPHVGTVTLANGVDIGANSTIDRATFGETRIGMGTKIDNLVMIAHNVVIGAKTLLCGQVGVSGSTKIGDEVILAGQVGVADHSAIGDRVKIAAQSGVMGSVKSDQTVAGYPVVDHKLWRRMQTALFRLPELLVRVRGIEKKLGISKDGQ